MITGVGSLLVASCLGCTNPNTTEPISVSVGPVPDSQAFGTQDVGEPIFGFNPDSEFRLPLKLGNDFSPGNFARPRDAARIEVMDLSTPAGVRAQQSGQSFSAEVAFSASRERTGLGLDVEFAPRAQIQRNQSGNDVARTGAEFRVGDLSDRDQRGSKARAPAWYFFVGADNEALVWNVADRQAMDGVALRDQVTVGDLQAGVAWSIKNGGQMSFGMVERELEFNDIAGDNDVQRKDHFAAFSFTFKR